VEIKKTDLYGVSTGPILARFSNAAGVSLTRSRKGLIGSAGIGFQNADKSQLAMVESSASDRFAFAQCSL
jgi:hypothetical protein